MIHHLKRYPLLLLFLITSPLQAERKHFSRSFEDNGNISYQNAVASYRKGDVLVTLVGSTHVAEKACYDQVQKILEEHEAILFEFLGNPADLIERNPKAMRQLEQSSGMRKHFSEMLELTSQVEGIDYSDPRFIHADFSSKQYQEALAEFKKTPAAKKGPDPARMAEVMKIVQQVSPETLAFLNNRGRKQPLEGAKRKKFLAEITRFLSHPHLIRGLKPESAVIIGARNKHCLEVLEKQIAKGRTRLAIYFGSAHLAEMEESLLKNGYAPEGERKWINVWTVAQPDQPAQPKAEDKAKEPLENTPLQKNN